MTWICNILPNLKLLSLLMLFDLLLSVTIGAAAEIPEINFRLSGNELYVSTAVTVDQKIMDELNDGL